MLVLLPPSEGKTRPTDGPPLDLDALSFPRLTQQREQLARTLVRVASGTPKRAAEVLGLGPTQADALDDDAALMTAPTGRADEVYTGVLFMGLEPQTLSPKARRRSEETLAVASGLFGLLRPHDLIPAYRLSGTVSLPRLGPIAGRWRTLLPRTIAEAAGDGLVVDLRSGAYVALGRVPADLTDRTATMRVLHEVDGKRSVVSHFNKATKGRVVRALLESGADPATPTALAETLRDLGWVIEQQGSALDLVVTEV